MAVALVAAIFFAVMGMLTVLYAMHFRRRAISLGRERLRAALARTVSGEDEAAETELRQGASELEGRLRRALVAACAVLVAVLSLSVVLTAVSVLPGLSLALSGLCVFLASLCVSMILLRDITRHAAGRADKG